MPFHAHLMHGLGWAMVAIFGYLWFGPYRRFKAGLAAGDPAAAAAALNRIRLTVTTNLALGLINAAIGASDATGPSDGARRAAPASTYAGQAERGRSARAAAPSRPCLRKLKAIPLRSATW